jgi:hypothetical protein
MKHGLITCDVCGAVGARTCDFHVDRCSDAAGGMDDQYESMDLCDEHAWAAYKIAEKRASGFELAREVRAQLRTMAVAFTDKRNAALQKLPK